MADLNAWKELLQPLFPLLGVVVGGLITGFGQLYKSRRERKRLIASALSELLEVRHRFVTLNAVLKHLQAHNKLPSVTMPHFRNFMDQLMPLDEKLDARFDDAVTLLAGVDPVFAFNLRSKNVIPRFINKMRMVATTTGEDLAKYEDFESGLIDVLTPMLDEAVLLVAKQHSGEVHRKVKKVLANKDSIGDDLLPLYKIAGLEAAS